MRPGPATQAASLRGFLLCLCHRCAVDDRFGPTALQGTPHLPKPAATRDLTIANRNCYGGPASPLLIKERGGGRNARGNQSRIRVSGNSRWLCRNHPALRTLTFSLHPLSGTTLPPAIQKKSPPVQNLWTTRLPCGRTRKTEKNLPSTTSRHPRLLVRRDATAFQIALEVIRSGLEPRQCPRRMTRERLHLRRFFTSATRLTNFRGLPRCHASRYPSYFASFPCVHEETDFSPESPSPE